MSDYSHPVGVEGTGSDIKWCNRHNGGKYCRLCGHHAKFKEWSNEWKWYYLVSWHDYDGYDWLKSGVVRWPFLYSRANSQYYRNWNKTGRKSWLNRGNFPKQPEPKWYSSRGLRHNEFNSLLKKGCRPNKKCRCISIVQRGNWYCPDCYDAVHFMAKFKGEHPHDIMIIDRNDFKKELLILKLSGVL